MMGACDTEGVGPVREQHPQGNWAGRIRVKTSATGSNSPTTDGPLEEAHVEDFPTLTGPAREKTMEWNARDRTNPPR